MSDKPISVGDLVQVVGACCEWSAKFLGRTFVVESLSGPDSCGGCDKKTTATAMSPKGGAYALWRLKRIPPLSELEGQRTEEKLKVPA